MRATHLRKRFMVLPPGGFRYKVPKAPVLKAARVAGRQAGHDSTSWVTGWAWDSPGVIVVTLRHVVTKFHAKRWSLTLYAHAPQRKSRNRIVHTFESPCSTALGLLRELLAAGEQRHQDPL